MIFFYVNKRLFAGETSGIFSRMLEKNDCKNYVTKIIPLEY